MKLFILMLLLVDWASPTNLQTTHEVIIIGAGASGIGASVALKAKNTEHIILEARSAMGGRIASGTINGVTVDLGASFVHYPLTQNSINSLVETMGWAKVLANYSQSQTFYQPNVTLSASEETTVSTLYSQFVTYVGQQAATTDTDLLTLWNQYRTTISNYSESIVNAVYYKVYLEGDVNGADLSQCSAKAFTKDSSSNANDYLPAGGYLSLLTAIYQRYSNATIVFNSAVTRVDYSGSTVTVTTSGGQTYQAKKIICSVPLGVLKAGSVVFNPPLPSAYQQAISNIGFGIFNKIIVTLSSQFYTSGKAIINLIDSGIFSYPQAFVVPDPTNHLLMFFSAGNRSKTLNNQDDASIATALNSYLTSTMGLSGTTVTNLIATRWENDPYSLGSYSYYKVGTTTADFSQLLTPIEGKVWLVGEHTHPNQSSNVHGAYQSGYWAGQATSWGVCLSICLWLLAILITV